MIRLVPSFKLETKISLRQSDAKPSKIGHFQTFDLIFSDKCQLDLLKYDVFHLNSKSENNNLYQTFYFEPLSKKYLLPKQPEI